MLAANSHLPIADLASPLLQLSQPRRAWFKRKIAEIMPLRHALRRGLRSPRLAEPPNRRPAPVGLADGDRADRRHAEGRHLPADFDRSRSPGARLVQGAMRGARLRRHRRRHGQHVRAPARQEPGAAADRHGLASRHPADRRQIRRRAWRARRARSAAHAARDRLRDQCADRDRQLDQRGRRALCAGDAGLGRLCRRVLARLRLCAHRSRRQNLRRGIGAHRLPRRGKSRRAHNSPRCSNCTSSKARSSKTKAA